MNRTVKNQRHIEVKMFVERDGSLKLGTPGTYVTNWSGRLVRVTDEGYVHGITALEVEVANAPKMTRISENPYLNIVQARVLAANMGLSVSF